jgi:hypothetical protein
MAEDQQELAWMDSLGEQQQDVVETPREQAAQTATVEDLREQIIQAEEEPGVEEEGALARSFLNMKPWQRLVLAVLLFLNVALCGCMALVMAGRVALPF